MGFPMMHWALINTSYWLGVSVLTCLAGSHGRWLALLPKTLPVTKLLCLVLRRCFVVWSVVHFSFMWSVKDLCLTVTTVRPTHPSDPRLRRCWLTSAAALMLTPAGASEQQQNCTPSPHLKLSHQRGWGESMHALDGQWKRGSFFFLNLTRWGRTLKSGSAPSFLPVKRQFFSRHCRLLVGKLLGFCSQINYRVQFRPASCGRCHEMAFDVNWHYTNKDLLIVTNCWAALTCLTLMFKGALWNVYVVLEVISLEANSGTEKKHLRMCIQLHPLDCHGKSKPSQK